MMKHKIIFAVLLLCLAVLSGCGNSAPAETTAAPEESPFTEIKGGLNMPNSYYTNPLTDSAADPVILYEDGTYYLYSTGNKTISVRTSKNLLLWEKAAEPALTLNDFDWAIENCWAPEVYKHNDRYYMAICARRENGLFAIDVAMSKSPLGPFKPINERPILAPDYSVIDANIFWDDDGKTYLFYSKDCSTNVVDGKNTSQIYGVEVTSNLSKTIGEAVLLTTPDRTWERKSGSTLWNEGPVCIKHGEYYYMLYSANCYAYKDYSVGYAMATSPLGPYIKPASNCLLKGDNGMISGTGHCNYFVAEDPDEIYLCYHRHTVAPNNDNGRSLCIDRLFFHEDGTLYVDGPSNAERPLPNGAGGFARLRNFTIDLPAEAIVDGTVAALTDDHIMNNDPLTLRDGSTLTVKLEQPTSVYALWLYNRNGEDPAQMYEILIDGKYHLSGSIPAYSASTKPLILTLSELPEGYAASEIAITLKTENGEAFSLLELALISKAAQ